MGAVPVGIVPLFKKLQPENISKRPVEVNANTRPVDVVYKPLTGADGSSATGRNPGALYSTKAFGSFDKLSKMRFTVRSTDAAGLGACPDGPQNDSKTGIVLPPQRPRQGGPQQREGGQHNCQFQHPKASHGQSVPSHSQQERSQRRVVSDLFAH